MVYGHCGILSHIHPTVICNFSETENAVSCIAVIYLVADARVADAVFAHQSPTLYDVRSSRLGTQSLSSPAAADSAAKGSVARMRNDIPI